MNKLPFPKSNDIPYYDNKDVAGFLTMPVEIYAKDSQGYFVPVNRPMNAKEPFSGSTNKVHTFTQHMNGFTIRNDGANNNLTFTINNYTFTVLPGEELTLPFERFNQVIIVASEQYRAWGLG